MQYLVIIALIAFIYFFYIKERPSKKSFTKEDSSKANDMVECAKCGIYCEIDDAILSNGKYYCSKECIKG